jgi:hypothetical protein
MKAGVPGFTETLEKMQEIHLSKNADYATGASKNHFFNFDTTRQIISLFHDDRDKVFVWPIANKLSRLASLLKSGKVNNESVEDSLIDIANYVILWKCDIARR